MAKQDAEKRERPKKANNAGENNFAYIYGLADPETDQIKYIGKAINPFERYKGHLRNISKKNSPVYKWMNMLPERPKLIVLACCLSEDWQSVERQVISQYRSESTILNVADGGNQPKTDSTICRENGYKLNANLSINPKLKKIQSIKRAIANFVRGCDNGSVDPSIAARVRFKLKLAAFMAPDLFGQYKNI